MKIAMYHENVSMAISYAPPKSEHAEVVHVDNLYKTPK